MRILVVEDDAETAAYITRGLEEAGHVVNRAADGQDGLFLATGGGHDVMVVDRMLPKLDGLSMVRAVRAAGIATPAIFLTARAGVGEIQAAGRSLPGRAYLARGGVDQLDAVQLGAQEGRSVQHCTVGARRTHPEAVAKHPPSNPWTSGA